VTVVFDRPYTVIDPIGLARDFTSREPSDSPQILQR
jgi:hypothetical protein